MLQIRYLIGLAVGRLFCSFIAGGSVRVSWIMASDPRVTSVSLELVNAVVEMNTLHNQILCMLDRQIPRSGVCAGEEDLRAGIINVNRVIVEGREALMRVVNRVSARVRVTNQQLADSLTQETVNSILRVLFFQVQESGTQAWSYRKEAGLGIDGDTVIIGSTAD